jgi:hypothetical protein
VPACGCRNKCRHRFHSSASLAGSQRCCGCGSAARRPNPQHQPRRAVVEGRQLRACLRLGVEVSRSIRCPASTSTGLRCALIEQRANFHRPKFHVRCFGTTSLDVHGQRASCSWSMRCPPGVRRALLRFTPCAPCGVPSPRRDRRPCAVDRAKGQLSSAGHGSRGRAFSQAQEWAQHGCARPSDGCANEGGAERDAASPTGRGPPRSRLHPSARSGLARRERVSADF